MHDWTVDANDVLASLLSLAELMERLARRRILAGATGASLSSKLGLKRGHSNDGEGFESVREPHVTLGTASPQWTTARTLPHRVSPVLMSLLAPLPLRERWVSNGAGGRRSAAEVDRRRGARDMRDLSTVFPFRLPR